MFKSNHAIKRKLYIFSVIPDVIIHYCNYLHSDLYHKTIPTFIKTRASRKAGHTHRKKEVSSNPLQHWNTKKKDQPILNQNMPGNSSFLLRRRQYTKTIYRVLCLPHTSCKM